MASDDFRINASVHTTLIRFWIDTATLQFGTTNGVVYLRGSLRRPGFKSRSAKESEDEAPFLAKRLEGHLKQIRGVRDVVTDLANVQKLNGRWILREAS